MVPPLKGSGKMMPKKRDVKTLKRINVGLTEQDHTKLERLSFAVSIPKTILAAEILTLCLSNPNIIEFIQDRFKAAPERRVKPMIAEDGQVKYS
jgi:hypothetical protein